MKFRTSSVRRAATLITAIAVAAATVGVGLARADEHIPAELQTVTIGPIVTPQGGKNMTVTVLGTSASTHVPGVQDVTLVLSQNADAAPPTVTPSGSCASGDGLDLTLSIGGGSGSSTRKLAATGTAYAAGGSYFFEQTLLDSTVSGGTPAVGPVEVIQICFE